MANIPIAPALMKHRCPHCQKPGVTHVALRWSTRESPAQCSYCGGLSHVLARTSGGIGVFTWMTLIVGCTLAVVLASWPVAALAVLIAIGGNMALWPRCELFPTDRKTAQTANRVGWAAELAAWLTVLVGLG